MRLSLWNYIFYVYLFSASLLLSHALNEFLTFQVDKVDGGAVVDF